MNVLFLDIDGVLNSESYYYEHIWKTKKQTSNLIDPRAVEALNFICESCAFAIVISSTWRLLHDEEEIRRILISKGFMYPGRIIDKTPDLQRGCRGDEIEYWITHTSHKIDKCLILDDDSDMGNLMDCLYKTTWRNGLTFSDAKDIIKIFKGDV